MKDFIAALRKFPAKFIYFSVLAIFLGLAGSVIYVLVRFATEDTAQPKDVVVSNVTDQSVSISWVTEKPVVGSVLVSKTDSWNILNEFGKTRFWDDRDVRYDVVGKHYVHHVTIDGLEEDTKYYYRISTGYRRYALDIAGDKLPDMETGPVLEALQTPDPIYGKIFDNNGNPVSEEVLFYIQLRNVNGDWSTVLSGITNAEGGWTVDRTNARTTDFSDLFSSAGGGDIALLNANGYSLTGVYLGEGKLEIPFGQDKPAANLFLSEKIAVAMNFNEPVVYSENFPVGNPLVNLPNFSFVNKASAQVCTEGEYNRRCTGNQAGCASNAGEAEVKQCGRVTQPNGTVTLDWKLVGGECSTACDIQEVAGGRTIKRTERVADGCGCSCQGGLDLVCQDQIKRFWDDGFEDSTCEAGTYLANDARCKPAAVTPAPTVPAPDDTCSRYAVNTWMCAGVGAKNLQGQYNCGKFQKENNVCSWNPWKSGDSANPPGCGNCQPTEEAGALPDEQEDKIDEFKATIDAAKFVIELIRKAQIENEGFDTFLSEWLSKINGVDNERKPGMSAKEIGELISKVQGIMAENNAIYNSYLEWKETCTVAKCSFKAWVDQGKPGAEKALTVEEIDELIINIAWLEFKIRISDTLKNIIRSVVLGISNVDVAKGVIREGLRKNTRFGELPRISSDQVCENADGCTCGPIDPREGDFNVGYGYNCLKRAKNGIQCDRASQCISDFCGQVSKKCEVKPAETGTVSFSFTVADHPKMKIIPQMTFKLTQAPTNNIVVEEAFPSNPDIGTARTLTKTLSNLELGYVYTVSVSGSDSEATWSFSTTFVLTETQKSVFGDVRANTITSDEPVTLVINFDAFLVGISTLFTKPENLNIELLNSDGVAKYRDTVSKASGYRAQFNDVNPGVYTVTANKEDCGDPRIPFRWNTREQITVAPTGQDQSLIINVPIYSCNDADIAAFNIWNEGCRKDPSKSALTDCVFEKWVDAGKPSIYSIGSAEVGAAPAQSMKVDNLLTKFGKLFKEVFSKAHAAEVPRIEGSGVYQFTIEGLEVTTPPVQILTYGDETVEIKVFDDANRNGIKDEEEGYIDVTGLAIKIDKLSSTELFRLNKGWNLISFPITTFVDNNGNGIYDDGDEGFATAKGLIEEIISQGGYATTVSTYSAGQWNTYVERAGESKSNDFYLIPGEAYFIRVHTPITLSVSGNKFADSVPVHLTSGWNLKGIISPNNYHTAESVIDSINESVEGAEADTVTQYIRGGYDNFIKTNGDVFGFDYGIENKMGYFIRLKAGSGLWDPRYIKLSE